MLWTFLCVKYLQVGMVENIQWLAKIWKVQTADYSGREAPSLRMGSFFLGGGCWLVGAPPIIMLFARGQRVGPFSLEVELKVYSNELWNELHNHAQMYRNVLRCTPNGPSTLASASLVQFVQWYVMSRLWELHAHIDKLSGKQQTNKTKQNILNRVRTVSKSPWKVLECLHNTLRRIAS